jgi:NAD(P)-dependent dehydrogenase (short-subunit alcohol dehydrogenase family)
MDGYRKKIIITGGSSGIGKAAAMELAQGNVEIIITGSNIEKGEKAVKEITEATGNNYISFMSCNLIAFKYVKSFVTRVKNKWNTLDVLVNNAGKVNPKRQITDDGHELTFQVNYLSHFLLTLMLLDLLKKSKDGRIINVASRREKYTNLDLNDLKLEKKYNLIKAYDNSKQAQILFTYEMAERYPGISVNAMHPGGVATNIYNIYPVIGFLAKLASPFMISPKKGAETLVYLAISEDVRGVTGKYFYKKQDVHSSPASYNKRKQKELWELSRRSVGYNKDVIQKRQNIKKTVQKKTTQNKKTTAQKKDIPNNKKQ